VLLDRSTQNGWPVIAAGGSFGISDEFLVVCVIDIWLPSRLPLSAVV
jgi:hypothetical protein